MRESLAFCINKFIVHIINDVVEVNEDGNEVVNDVLHMKYRIHEHILRDDNTFVREMDILVKNLFLDIINYDVKWLNVLKIISYKLTRCFQLLCAKNTFSFYNEMEFIAKFDACPHSKLHYKQLIEVKILHKTCIRGPLHEMPIKLK
jgi:hypothetical protein